MRIIIKQCVEWQNFLYGDFEKAFDSLGSALEIPRSLWPTPKIINLIKNMYQDFNCQVIDKGKLSDTFAITTGVQLGCLHSPLIFLIAIDWIMRRTSESKRTGTQWTLFAQLEDLDFADYLAPISEKHTHMHQKTDRFQIPSPEKLP